MANHMWFVLFAFYFFMIALGKAQSVISEEPIVPTEAIHSGIAKEHMITIMESRDDHLPHRSSKVRRDNTSKMLNQTIWISTGPAVSH